MRASITYAVRGGALLAVALVLLSVAAVCVQHATSHAARRHGAGTDLPLGAQVVERDGLDRALVVVHQEVLLHNHTRARTTAPTYDIDGRNGIVAGREAADGVARTLAKRRRVAAHHVASGVLRDLGALRAVGCVDYHQPAHVCSAGQGSAVQCSEVHVQCVCT